MKRYSKPRRKKPVTFLAKCRLRVSFCTNNQKGQRSSREREKKKRINKIKDYKNFAIHQKIRVFFGAKRMGESGTVSNPKPGTSHVAIQ